MNCDDIIRMAQEAATEDGSVNRSDGKNIVIYAAKTSLFLERFAALVAAAEREACARMAEAFHQHGYDFTGDLELHDAIRARGQV